MDKIEAAIQVETVHRYQLAAEWVKSSSGFHSPPSWSNNVEDDDDSNNVSANPKWIEVELAAAERRRQALVLLLLYFNAGWLDAVAEEI